MECLDYYVFGLNFKDRFLTNEQCERLKAHWDEQDGLINVQRMNIMEYGMVSDSGNFLGFGIPTPYLIGVNFVM